MNIESRKLSFIQEFLRVQNEEIISGLEKLLRKKRSEQYDRDLKPMNLEQFNNEIDQAIDDSENDQVVKAADLRQKWD